MTPRSNIISVRVRCCRSRCSRRISRASSRPSRRPAFTGNPFGLPDSLAIAACGALYPATCNPASNNWVFSFPANTPGGKLRGFEINYQQPFRFLPRFLKNTGVLLNYTQVTSNIKYLNGAGVVVVAHR